MKEKFKNVDFMRFVFAILIVMFHFRLLAQDFVNNYIPGVVQCNVCVDFFFIISGFFLFYTIDTKQTASEFAMKKFFRLAPLVWFFLAVYMVLSLFLKGLHFSLTDNILRIFLLSDIGFGPLTGGIGSHVHWFIPALFWTMLGYFYLAKLVNKKYLNPLILLITVVSYGLYLNFRNFQTGGNLTNAFYFVNIGVLRAVGGMGLGYFIHNLYLTGFLKKCSKIGKLIISGLEIYLIGFLTHYLLFTDKVPGKTPLVFFIIFSVLFYLFLIRKGVVSSFLNKDFLARLGKYSYAIYVMHPLAIAIIKKYIHKDIYIYILSNKSVIPPSLALYVIYVICGVALGVITYYIFEKPVNKLIKKYLFKRD